MRSYMPLSKKNGSLAIMKHTKISFFSSMVFVVFLLMTVSSCSRNDDSELLKPASIPLEDPAHVVVDILNSMASGQIDHTKIIYGEKQEPLPVIRYAITPYFDKKEFHNVKFKVERIRLCRFDAKTQTVRYSCIVPHPAVAFWQWDAVDPSELEYVPRGIRMKGRFTLVKDEKTGWNVKIDSNTNPVSLYNQVVSSINRTWFTFMKAGKASPELIQFNVLMLIASYAIALDIPDKDSKEFAEEVMKEFEKVVPQRNK